MIYFQKGSVSTLIKHILIFADAILSSLNNFSLVSVFSSHSILSDAEAAIREHRHLLFSGLTGSSRALYAAFLSEHICDQHVFICADKESAAYFYNDIENLFHESQADYSKKKVLFYPASYKRPYEPEKADRSSVLSRAEVLERLYNSRRKTLIISYPEALCEKVISRQYLERHTLTLKTGDKVSLDFIADVLDEYGFEAVDFVVEPGQFSMRGGIIDLFSYSNEYPYRLEFFGNEIESIRSFDPIGQLSLQLLNRIKILPDIQDREVETARQSFLEQLSSDALIWIEEATELESRLQSEFDKVSEVFAQQQESERFLHQAFTDSKQILQALTQSHTIEFGNRSILQASHKIEFAISPQPSFNKNFSLLLADLKEKHANDYTTYLLADNAKQIERIITVLEDMDEAEDTDEQLVIPVYHSLQYGFTDHQLKISCYTDHQIFERYHKFQLRDGFAVKEALTIKELYDLKPGDFVSHIDHGIGRFDGLEIIDNNGKKQEAVRLIYKNDDLLYVSIHSLHRISKYTGKDGTAPVLNKLGSNAWNKLKHKTKTRVKDIARDLITLYAKRKANKGHAFLPDTYLQAELEASFIYEDTPDQLKATQDVKADMESDAPMDRLICGDVGFGKTEIAIRAAFKAVTESKQVAVLVPTTILALQHYKTFSERLKEMPVTIDFISRFKTAAQQKQLLENLKKGSLDILIGTHRIIGNDIIFKDLGLIIIDEEQKFGVAAKEKLKSLKTNVDTLTLTATPIPRTLQFSMMGARDLSIIQTPPPNRYPIQTEIRPFNHEVIQDNILFEINRGGQVFFVHNRVQNIMEIYDMLQKIVPGITIGVGHGQMQGEQLEKVMFDFIEGKTDVLLATTIIESGLDIPNANTIFINDAHQYGLSDLHQLRGRVGRSNKKAFCYLLAPPMTLLTNEAQKRLRAIEMFSELGSGFNISLRDLDIRGAGNLLGGEQSGFINEIGFEMFHKILDEAISELKEDEFSGIFETPTSKRFVKECSIESDMEILLPTEYVYSTTERISLYNQLDNIQDEEKLQEFTNALIDRFGPLPRQAADLINTIRLRWIAREIGFEKLILRNKTLIGYFISQPDSPYFQSKDFEKVLRFLQANERSSRIKEQNNKLMLYLNNVRTVNAALDRLNQLLYFELP